LLQIHEATSHSDLIQMMREPRHQRTKSPKQTCETFIGIMRCLKSRSSPIATNIKQDHQCNYSNTPVKNRPPNQDKKTERYIKMDDDLQQQPLSKESLIR